MTPNDSLCVCIGNNQLLSVPGQLCHNVLDLDCSIAIGGASTVWCLLTSVRGTINSLGRQLLLSCSIAIKASQNRLDINL